MDASVENSITYHGSEKDFYAFIDKKNLTENFEKHLVQFLKTFTRAACVEGGVSL